MCYSFAHLTLIISLHYTMNSYWVTHASTQKITETTKSMKICYLLTLIAFVLRSFVDELK